MRQDHPLDGFGAEVIDPDVVALLDLEALVLAVGEQAQREGKGREWLRLEVRRLGLYHGHENVAGVGELVLIHDGVLRGCAPEPGAVALDEDAAADVNVDLALGDAVHVVVGYPEPGVFHVRGRARCELHHQRRPHACLVDLACVLGALLVLQI